ncbi:MAG: hypothetical protein AAF569_01515 [Pseudomonadota bacterium]
MNDDLNQLLNKKYAPDAPSNLAYRIIDAAKNRKNKKPRNVWEELSWMFIVPRPALALGVSVLIGLMIGFQGGSVLDTSLYSDWTSFLIVDEGGWL